MSSWNTISDMHQTRTMTMHIIDRCSTPVSNIQVSIPLFASITCVVTYVALAMYTSLSNSLLIYAIRRVFASVIANTESSRPVSSLYHRSGWHVRDMMLWHCTFTYIYSRDQFSVTWHNYNIRYTRDDWMMFRCGDDLLSSFGNWRFEYRVSILEWLSNEIQYSVLFFWLNGFLTCKCIYAMHRITTLSRFWFLIFIAMKTANYNFQRIFFL